MTNLTPTALYERLREMFGLGDFDEETSAVPYHQWRIREVAKLKAMLNKRRVPPERLLLAAEYAVAERKPITEAWQLFDLILPALVDLRRREREENRTSTGDDIRAAIGESIESEEDLWTDRFLRLTPGPEADQVLAEWRDYIERKNA